MVIVLAPVETEPVVMLITGTVTLFCNVTTLDEALLLTVSILNEVAPVIDALFTPVICMVLVPAVKVPLFIQLPKRVCV